MNAGRNCKQKKDWEYIAIKAAPELKARLQKIAERENRSLAAQAFIFLSEGVEHREAEKLPAAD